MHVKAPEKNRWPFGTLLRLAISLGLVAGIVWWLGGVGRVATVIGHISFGWAVIVVLLFMLDRALMTFKWLWLLRARGIGAAFCSAEVAYYDPYVPVIKSTREHSQFAGKKSVQWHRATIENFDVVLIATNHSCVNYHELGEWARCIVDTRNAMAFIKGASGKVWKA